MPKTQKNTVYITPFDKRKKGVIVLISMFP